MVKTSVVLRYASATSPKSNLKYEGDKDIPLTSFRTDQWDLPESDDPYEKLFDRVNSNERNADAQQRLEQRRLEEPK